MSNDKRHFKRIEFDAKTYIINDSGNFETTLIDISLHGALIEKPDNLNVSAGDKLSVELHLSGSDVQIGMKMQVVHIEDNHIGLVCENIDIDSATHLRRLVELNLGDSTLLDRELSELTHIKD